MDWVISFVMNRIGLDSLIAMGINWLLTKLQSSDKSSGYYREVKGILVKSSDTIQIALSILADDKVEDSEVAQAKEKFQEIWAAKTPEAKVSLK